MEPETSLWHDGFLATIGAQYGSDPTSQQVCRWRSFRGWMVVIDRGEYDSWDENRRPECIEHWPRLEEHPGFPSKTPAPCRKCSAVLHRSHGISLLGSLLLRSALKPNKHVVLFCANKYCLILFASQALLWPLKRPDCNAQHQ